MKLSLACAGSLLVGLCALTSFAAEPKPYTHQNFLDDPEEFHFAIIPDRTGGDHRGAWTNALEKVNLLRPAFVMTVGDLIPAGWLDEKSVIAQQEELKEQIKKVVPPFYSVVGNHDYQSPASKRIWQRYFGKDTYYSFLYKGVLFLALDTQDHGISDAQYAWARKTLRENAKARWIFIFMHAPDTWRGARWQAFERETLAGLKYTVFAGDLHTYYHARRNGNDYYALSVAGGGSAMNGQDPANDMNLMGPAYGEMDHITWVTVTKGGKPVIANLLVDGIFAGDYLDQSNSKTTYVTLPYDDPVDPKVAAHLEKLEKNRVAHFYRWDAKTFDRWTAPGGGTPDTAWTIADGALHATAAGASCVLENTKLYANADWHFQYRLEQGAEAKLVYVDEKDPSEAIEYHLPCRPETWTHGRLAVSGTYIELEIDGKYWKSWKRRNASPRGHFQLHVTRGTAHFRGVYVFDL